MYTEKADRKEQLRWEARLTLIGRHWTNLGNFLLASGVTGKATDLAHYPLAGEAHHEGGAVGALDGIGEGTCEELVSLVLHHVR